MPKFLPVAFSMLLLFTPALLRAQYFKIDGKFKIHKGNYDGASIHMYKNGQHVRTIQADGAKFEFQLEFQSSYILSFTKPGYITKKIKIETHVPEEKMNRGFIPFGFEVEIFEQYEGVNTVVFNQPVAVIAYYEDIDDFDYDTDYTKSIQAQLQDFEAQYKKQKKIADKVKVQEEKESEQKAQQEKKAEEKQQAQTENKQITQGEIEADKKPEAGENEGISEEEKRKQLQAEMEAEKRRKAEAALEEEKRKQQEARLAEEKRQAALKRQQEEEARKKREAALAEEKRLAEIKRQEEEEAREKAEAEAAEEARKQAELAKQKEEEERQLKLAEMKAAEEARKKAAKQRAAAEEERRKAAQAKIEAEKRQSAGGTEKTTEPDSWNKEVIEEDRQTITRITVVKDGEKTIYKKVKHNWGGVYYFQNEDNITKAEFENATRKVD